MKRIAEEFLRYCRVDSPWRFYGGLMAAFAGCIVLWGWAWFLSFGEPLSRGDRIIASWYVIKKDAARDASKKGKKILLAGGSNVLYGISAEQIERETGIPSVNFGTHAALNLDYLLWRTSRALKPGDILVLSLEWDHFQRPPFALNEVSAPYLVGGDPQYLKRLPWQQLTQMAMASGWNQILLPVGVNRREYSRTQRAFDRAAAALQLNPVGDMKGNRLEEKGEAQRRAIDQIVLDRNLVSEAKTALGDPIWKCIRGFMKSCRKKDIKVWIAFPSLMDAPFYRSQEATDVYRQFETNFRSLGARILTHQEATLYHKDHFFDTKYHLHADARAERTALIIAGLKGDGDGAAPISPP